ncbi:hypothetical protein HDU91_007311 [Kappamyces sp. JEL0680]|nr:hypothetical protein HDU91_007311 [Kappamyces sp. JEL0680]
MSTNVFISPPLQLLLELLRFWQPLEYDVAHIVAPLCLAFVPLIPLMWLRGLKVYVSYHVYLEYYRNHYIGDGSSPLSRFVNVLTDFLFPLIYYIPLAFFAEVVGIPSKTADFYVFQYSARVHLLKSGLDTTVFHPDAADLHLKHPAVTRSDSQDTLTGAGDAEQTVVIKSVVGVADHDIQDIRVLAGSGSEKGPILIYAGRLAMEKSIDFLVEAMALPGLADATLVIVGDGPVRGSLEEQACRIVGKDAVYSTNLMGGLDREKQRHRVIFTGMILDEKKVASFYAQADIFVSASGSETFGFTVAEAMACSTPAVVVKSGAFPQIYKMILHNMFDAGDLEGYVACCVKVYSDKSASKAARQIACSGFSIDSSVSDLLRSYYWIVDGCPEDL